MNLRPLVIILAGLNLVLMAFLLAGGPQIRSAQAEETLPVLRGRALEIVDAKGRVRASIVIQTPDASYKKPNGKPYPETVMLRLIDANGRPEVKIGASELGGGLGLIGEFDRAHVILEADGSETQLKLSNKDGQEKRIAP